MPDPTDADREEAEELGARDVGDRSTDGHSEVLYRTPDGRYFLWIDSAMDSDYGGAIFGEWKSEEEAREWLEQQGG